MLNRLKWYAKQLFPLLYVSNYGEHDRQFVSIWRMWFGRCFAIRTWKVAPD